MVSEVMVHPTNRSCIEMTIETRATRLASSGRRLNSGILGVLTGVVLSVASATDRVPASDAGRRDTLAKLAATASSQQRREMGEKPLQPAGKAAVARGDESLAGLLHKYATAFADANQTADQEGEKPLGENGLSSPRHHWQPLLIRKLHERATAVRALAAEKVVDGDPVAPLREWVRFTTVPSGKAAATMQLSQDIAYGDTVTSELSAAADTALLRFVGSVGEVVDISLTSPDFDTFLELTLEGSAIASNDDGGEGLNSLLDNFVLPSSGEYTIVARSFGTSSAGSFSVSLALEGMAVEFLGSTLSGAGGDLAFGGQIDLYSLDIADLTQVQIDLTSTEFDAFLSLYLGSGPDDRNDENQIGANDDGGEGLNSRISNDARSRYLPDRGALLLLHSNRQLRAGIDDRTAGRG